MPALEMEKPARMDEVLNEVSKITTAVTEALEDGVHSALRTVNQGRYAAEEAIDDARHAVKKNPFGALAIVLVAGALIGGLGTWMIARRRKHVEC